MPPEFNVIQYGHAFEKFNILKGAGNPQFGNGMGMHTKKVFTLVEDLTFLGGVKSADTIQQAGFTGSVGSDDGEDLTAEKPGLDVIQCLNSAEGQRHVLNFYNSVITHSVPLSAWVSF
jgi:hypothetical protein